MSFHITCDQDWHTESAVIQGWVGPRLVSIHLVVDTHQCWSLNGDEVGEVAGAIDRDLNFSPSTNTIAIRRLGLEVNQQKDIMAAWLRFPSFTLKSLPQTCRRVKSDLFRYKSGGDSFVVDLRTNPAGLVVDYPGIWKSEAVDSGLNVKSGIN